MLLPVEMFYTTTVKLTSVRHVTTARQAKAESSCVEEGKSSCNVFTCKDRRVR